MKKHKRENIYGKHRRWRAALSATSNKDTTPKAVSVGSFKGDYTNTKTAIKGEFAQWSAAAQQLQPAGSNSLFYTDKNGKIISSGPAKLKVDKDAKTVTITLRDNLKWSDGKAVTAKDVEFSLETLSTNTVASGNFTEAYTKIKGLTDFQNGKSKSI
ncbi:hypothetical protein Pfo_030903, partial [Paulownia fortunei]